MSTKAKVILGTLGTALVLFISLILFLRHLIIKSFPETKGTIKTNGISSSVKIYRDEFGVPHIFAENEHDLMFAVGYVHAQDRLWQMELTRRAGQGRLSELFGNLTLSFDKMLRTIGFTRIARRMEQTLHPESRRILQAYVEGVNFFITTYKGKYPIEFDVLKFEPEPWTIEHSLLIARLMAWELNMSWWSDLTLGDLINKVGERKALEVFPTYPADAPVIVPALRGKGYARSDGGFREITKAFQQFFGSDGAGAGSNCWVVDGQKSIKGKPLLANDPHLTMPAPSRWYELHMVGGGFNAVGVSIPGVPGIVIGHNQHIAWGMTNAMIDDCDFYVERIDSLNPNNYFFEGKWRPMNVYHEGILVKDSTSVPLTIRETHRGPIISNIHSFQIREVRVYPTEYEKNFPLSMRWTGLETSDEVYAFYLINRAKNWKEFQHGLREFTVPGQNFNYADVNGNIGYWCAGRLPIRNHQHLTIPSPGWVKDFDWRGHVPFEKLPHLYNPPEHFLATANNKAVDDSYPYYISNLWEPPSRIIRIRELLTQQTKFSVDDFKRMQFDYVSPHAREIVPYILRAFDGVSVSDPDVKTALTYFRNWNFEFTNNDVATTIFNVFFVKLLHNIYEDEMGEELFNNYIFLANIPFRVTTKLLQDSTSTWFDNVNTPEVETRDDIVQKSLYDAIAELRTKLGGELKTWQWGKTHQVTFQHLFGLVKPLDKIFNIGPFAVGGSSTTLNSGEYNFTNPYKNIVGPSMRQIVDLSDMNNSLLIITSGESGQPLHRHYDDQTRLWLNGQYHQMLMDSSSIAQSGWDLLVLQSSK